MCILNFFIPKIIKEGIIMQLNNTNNINLDGIKQKQEYNINNAKYVVNRYFDGEKTIKDILLEKISNQKLLLSN